MGRGQGSLAEQLRRETKTARDRQAAQEERQRRAEDRRAEAQAAEAFVRLLDELPVKMQQRAGQGFSSIELHCSDRTRALVRREFEPRGFKITVSHYEPFGSDPMFDRAFDTYYLSWAYEKDRWGNEIKPKRGTPQDPLLKDLRARKRRHDTREENKARREREARESAHRKQVKGIVERVVAELPAKMKEASKKGSSSYPIFRDYRAGDIVGDACYEIEKAFAGQGLKFRTSKEEPVGSDPLYPWTVYTFWVSW